MGATGSGQTSVSRIRLVIMTRNLPNCLQFINLASGSDLRVGVGLKSCTVDIKLSDEFILDGRAITMVDTPGFDGTSKTDMDALKVIAAFLATTYVFIGVCRLSIFRTERPNRYEGGSMLFGIVYVHRITDKRFTGIARRNFRMFCELCGDAALRNVVLVTNMWSEVSPGVGEARENELSTNFFKSALEKGARMVRHYDTAQSAHTIIRMIVGNHPVALQIQQELVDDGKDIINTAAGKAVDRELCEQIRRHQVELKGVQEEMEQTLKEEDEEMRRGLEEQTEKVKKNSKGVALNYAAEKETKVKELEREANEERERTKAEHRRQLANLNHHPQGVANVSVPDLPRLEKGVKRPQDQSGSSGGDDWIPIPIYK